MEFTYPSSAVKVLLDTVRDQTDEIEVEMDGLLLVIGGTDVLWPSSLQEGSKRIAACIWEIREALDGYKRIIPQEIRRVR